MGVNVKATNALTIGSLNDFAGLLTNLDEGDMFLIEDLHMLDKSIAEYLSAPMKDFKMDIIIDRGPNARAVRLNLPGFTLVGTATRKERMPASFLSSLQIVEDMDAYNKGDLAAIARRLAKAMGLQVDAEVPEEVALSARVSPCEVLNRLRHLRDYAHIKAHSKRITKEMAVEALKMLTPGQVTEESSRERQPKAVYLPNTAFILMWMDKSHAELDDISSASKTSKTVAMPRESTCL